MVEFKKIVGIGHNVLIALSDAESKLPYRPSQSLNYSHLKYNGPIREGESSKDIYFRVDIEYALIDQTRAPEKPRRRPIEDIVDKALEDNSTEQLTREEVKKMIDKSVDEAVKRFFKDWFNQK